MKNMIAIMAAFTLLWFALSCDQNFSDTCPEREANVNPGISTVAEVIPEEEDNPAEPVSVTSTYRITLVSVDTTESVSKPAASPAE